MLKEQYVTIFDPIAHLERLKRNAELPRAFIGRTAKTDRAVMLALIYIAMQIGAYTVHPGVRTLSEITGHLTRTVNKALWRLKKQGWITDTYQAHWLEGHASRWRLNWDAPFLQELDVTQPEGLIKNHFIWSGYCLGSISLTVYRTIFLNGSGVRKFEIQNLIGRSYKVISSSLDLLINENLVIKTGRMYSIREFDSKEELEEFTDSLLEKYDVNQKIGDKKERFEQERFFRKKALTQNHRLREDRKMEFIGKQIMKSKSKMAKLIQN